MTHFLLGSTKEISHRAYKSFWQNETFTENHGLNIIIVFRVHLKVVSRKQNLY